MPRWITVRQKFDYRWPGVPAMTHFSDAELGDQFVKDEIADFAVAKGYATEGKLDAAKRSTKGTGAKRKKSAKAADPGTIPPVDHEDAADADRPADRSAVDPDAE